MDRHISADAKNVARCALTDFDAYLAEEDEPTLTGLLRFSEHHTVGGLAGPWMHSSKVGERLFAEIDPDTTTTEWMTPPDVFAAMATSFDLDVCSPGVRAVPWIPAKRHLTKKQNGLLAPWTGFVWMNAPFGLRNGMLDWIDKFIQHGDGVALVPDFTSTEWWQTLTAAADAILFVRPKIQFLPKRQVGTNTLGSTLVAIGERGVAALQNAERNGRGICFRRDAARISSGLLTAAE
jgi:DNA N-6-adenine-methyltransferase (Dam)